MQNRCSQGPTAINACNEGAQLCELHQYLIYNVTFKWNQKYIAFLSFKHNKHDRMR